MEIICEAGLGWSNFKQTIEYAEAAKEIGADIVKYQWVVNPHLPQMNKGEWKALKGYCDKIGIEFLCTPSTFEIMHYLRNELECRRVKIGSDRVEEFEQHIREHDLVSNGWYEGGDMYCVSAYPCDPKLIDWGRASHYIGFSDHTLRYDKEWCDKIKEHGFEIYEKHMTMGFNDIDRNVSLTKDEFKELVENLR